MLASFLIVFRESLEAALIIGIILAYLNRTGKSEYNNIVYLGVASAIVASVILALLFNALAVSFTGQFEEIFEGTTMLVAAAILTYMIFWMLKQSHVTEEMQEKISSELDSGHKFGLFFVSFIAVFREGIETVLFLGAVSFSSTGADILIGGIVGIVIAVMLGYILFATSKKVNIKKFFTATSILLILFAAGLTAHGVHEFQEAGVIPVFVEEVWDINPELNPDGSYPMLHEKGTIGEIAKGLFGYNGNPSLLEVAVYILYFGVIGLIYRKIELIHKFI